MLLAGIAFVIYRLRKRSSPTDDDPFNRVDSPIAAQKSPNASGWGQSNLTNDASDPQDRYRSPGGQQGTTYVPPSSYNAASNF